MKDLEAELAHLRARAMDEDWHIREDAGFTLRDMLEADFDEVFPRTSSWPTDEDERVRRAACLGCMQRKSKTTADRVHRVLERLDSLMTDDALYVRKCCGPFVVGYLGYTYPSITLPWLAQQALDQDLNRRTNVAKAFSQALGRTHPEAAAAILQTIENDDRGRVRSAVLASVRNVGKTDHGRLALQQTVPQLWAMANRNVR
jgi:3-methyladenine DNA glycosylase AlkC